jgi:hypothetical protein
MTGSGLWLYCLTVIVGLRRLSGERSFLSTLSVENTAALQVDGFTQLDFRLLEMS